MKTLLGFARQLGRVWFTSSLTTSFHRITIRAMEKYIQAWSSYTSRLGLIDTKDIAPYAGNLFIELPWLFRSGPSNRGVLRLDFDEAALLSRFSRSITHGKILELGRYSGGSTLLIAASKTSDVSVISIDSCPQDDEQLAAVLYALNLHHSVWLIHASSQDYETTDDFDLIFVDGDHLYRGVREDFLKWSPHLAIGGHILFHDAVKSRANASVLAGPRQLVDEVLEEGSYEIVAMAGSMSCLKKLR